MPWALVKDNRIIEVVSGDFGITIGDVQHPAQIFGSAWTDAEREAIGVFPVRIEGTKDEAFWLETGTEYLIGKGKVIGRKEYVARDLDEVKTRMTGRIKGGASKIINAVMPSHKQRNSLAAMVILTAKLAQGGELATEENDRFAKHAADWSYIEEVRAFSEQLEAQLMALTTMEEVEKFDFRDGWPLQTA